MKRSLFNCMMLCGQLPEQLLMAETVLVPKTSTPDDPGGYRPLTVASVVVRHFHKVLAKR